MNTSSPQPLIVSPETMLPDLFRAHPETRAVFDCYGLKGCGGTQGPAETITFFSRTHGVDETRLLDEIREAIRKGPQPEATASPANVADTIYRRFFTAGVLVVLTAGATWGAWLLWKIGMAGAFTSASIHEVNAHGHAQIYGWVGLFIMGFAYQAFPRIWHTELKAPRLAVCVFSAMIVGLIARTLGMTLAGAESWPLYAAMAGGILEAIAIVTFAVQILVTFHYSEAKWQPYVGFIAVALGWFVLMSVGSVIHTWNTMTAVSQEQLLGFVATWQAPLRDLQIHGLALFMILGVSIRMLPAFFELRAVPNRRAWAVLVILVVAVVGEVTFFVLHRITGNHVWAAGLLLPWTLMTVGVALIVLPWRLWRPLPVSDRSAKFVRAAYAWLAVSLMMMLLLPVYLYASNMTFSHAYYGAIRHAVTVGFISLMIMGFSAKVVPTLNGIDPRGLSALWGPFLLVNIGCFLRVTTQTLTDWNDGLFAVIGLSGTLEVTGLTWWGIGLIAVIVRGKREENSIVEPTTEEPPLHIEPGHKVAQVLAWFPQTENIFIEHGFTALRNPLLRRTLARQVTLAQATDLRGVEIEPFIQHLNAAIGINGKTDYVAKEIIMNMLKETVGSIVAQQPGLSRVFEQMGIDYCCGGKKTLELACLEKDLDPQGLVTLLKETQTNGNDENMVNTTTMSLTELADHIEQTHHAFLRSELPRLIGMTEKVAGVHGEEDPRLHQVKETFLALAEELLSHMMKEEQILFPMIRQLEVSKTLPEFHCGTLAHPIQQMEHEHDGAGSALERLRDLTDGYTPPSWACNTYRAMLDALAHLERDMHQHIHKENSVLFPRALVMENEKGS